MGQKLCTKHFQGRCRNCTLGPCLDGHQPSPMNIKVHRR